MQDNSFENSLVELENNVLESKKHLDSAISLVIMLARASENDKHVNNQALAILENLNKVDKLLRN